MNLSWSVLCRSCIRFHLVTCHHLFTWTELLNALAASWVSWAPSRGSESTPLPSHHTFTGRRNSWWQKAPALPLGLVLWSVEVSRLFLFCFLRVLNLKLMLLLTPPLPPLRQRDSILCFWTQLYFSDSLYKWYHVWCVFVWLISLSIIPSRFIHMNLR